MDYYCTKVIDYNFKKKIVSYAIPIRTGGHNHAIRKNYQDMNEEEKKRSDLRRLKYYQKAGNKLVELALMNPLKVMITVTFREHITDYRIALQYWKNFIKRLKYSFDEDIKYICTWERMSKTEQSRDRIHFHALISINLSYEDLKKLWGYGYVWVSRITDGKNGRQKTICYITKYITKSIQKQIESGNSVRGERFFFCSKNLEKPKIEMLKESISIPDVIFENMENVIKDGAYTVHDNLGHTFNKIEYVEILKSSV